MRFIKKVNAARNKITAEGQHQVDIKTVADFERELKAEHVFPGGYTKVFAVADGGTLAWKTAKEEQKLIKEAIADPGTDEQWEVNAVFINWEDEDLYDDHTGKKIPSEYGSGD